MYFLAACGSCYVCGSPIDSLVDIKKQCRTVSLAHHLSAARLRWLGHVVRMDEGRMPHVALFLQCMERLSGLGASPKLGGRIVHKQSAAARIPSSNGWPAVLLSHEGCMAVYGLTGFHTLMLWGLLCRPRAPTPPLRSSSSSHS